MEILSIIIASIIGIIPGIIAQKKGHSFWLWWFYGWMLFIIAIIHVHYIEDKSEAKCSVKNVDEFTVTQLERYKNLMDLGAISRTEYEEKKQELMKR